MCVSACTHAHTHAEERCQEGSQDVAVRDRGAASVGFGEAGPEDRELAEGRTLGSGSQAAGAARTRPRGGNQHALLEGSERWPV